MSVRRIAYVVNAFPKLSETFVAGEVAQVLECGVDVRILSLRSPGEPWCHGFVTRAGLTARTVYDRTAFKQSLRDFQPDLLHAHFATEPAAAARELAGELGVRFTFTAHGYDVYRRPPADFADRAAAAAAVVTVSEANARHIVKSFRVARDRIHVIPCGVDTSRFCPRGQRAEPPLIVCVARLRPVKNHELLLEACALLLARGVKFRCVLVGDGPSRPDLERLTTDLGLDDVVTFVGAAEQTQVLEWWRQATVGVLTSKSEGMPVCLMEAAACGVPSVATAVGGIPEIVEDGLTGVLTPPGDATAIAAALERLLIDPALAGRLGAAARRSVKERFSITRQGDRLLALWAELLQKVPA